MQQKLSEDCSLDQTQVKNERLKMQNQKLYEPANQLLRKQKLERIDLLQQLDQPDTIVQDDNTTLEIV